MPQNSPLACAPSTPSPPATSVLPFPAHPFRVNPSPAFPPASGWLVFRVECSSWQIRVTRGIHTLRAARQARVSIDGEKELAMKQNVTISLDRQMIRKAKIVAARRDTSISGLLAQQLEILVGEEEAYERAERQAVALLEEGFHLGGGAPASREELHER